MGMTWRIVTCVEPGSDLTHLLQDRYTVYSKKDVMSYYGLTIYIIIIFTCCLMYIRSKVGSPPEYGAFSDQRRIDFFFFFKAEEKELGHV